jgi:hypothetical protein
VAARYLRLVLLLALAACAGQSSLTVLNSDMIRARFGSYGVEILHGTEQQRISSLYSDEQGYRITRTFAVVDFAAPLPVALAAAHARISNGGSIGETFRSTGWGIEKHHIFIGEINVGTTHARIGQLMDIQLPQPLATHVYIFVVTKDERSLSYATITEGHHPDFLRIDDLRKAHGEMLFDDSARDSLDDLVALPEPFSASIAPRP